MGDSDFLSLSLIACTFCVIVLCLFIYGFFYQRLFLQRLKLMLDHVDFPLWINKDDQELIYCNQAYAIFFEGSLKEAALKQKSLIRFMHEDTLRKTMIVQGERRVYVFRYKKILNLKIIWGMDETQTESLNQELKRHADAYRAVLESLSAGIVIYGPNRRLTFFNHAYNRMFQFDPEWLESSPSLGEVLDDLRDRRLLTEQADYMAYRKRELEISISALTPFEEMMHIPDGRSFRKVMAPHPFGGCFYIFEDVTNSLVLERQYNTQMAVQKASIDNLFEGVAVFGSDNRLRFTNPAFEQLWQWKPNGPNDSRHMSELLDHIRHLFAFEGDWENYKKKMIARVTDRIPKSVRFFRKDGKVITFSYVPLPDGSHLMTYVDVTDSHKIESLLREKNEILETTDKLKSEFISNISYELRNPLQAILGFGELLDQESFGPLNERQKNFSNHILTATQTLLELVTTILDISTVESGNLTLSIKSIDVTKMINSVVRIIRARAKQLGITLSVKMEKHLGSFRGDEARLKQALFNVLSNSLKNSHAGQELSVHITGHIDQICFKVQYGGHNSPGSRQCFGLGLSLVQSLVKLHGGELTMETSENLVFVVMNLPRNQMTEEAAA